jgi:predicted transcriptional regulator
MAKCRNFPFKKQTTIVDDEDKATLAAIDEGIRDAKAGRTVPVEKVRKLLHQCVTNSWGQSLETPVTSSASPIRRKGHTR